MLILPGPEQPKDKHGKEVGYGDVLEDESGHHWRIGQVGGGTTITLQSLTTWQFQNVDREAVSRMTWKKEHLYSQSTGWRYRQYGKSLEA
jgi:hypothetical protein